MQSYELEVILDLLEYTYKNEWEQTRFLSYIIAQTQSTKRLKPTDILSFIWDKDKPTENKLNKEDIERLTNKMNEIIKINKEKDNGRFSNSINLR